METSLTRPAASSADVAQQPIPREWVARVFQRLTAQLGAKVADLYAGVPQAHVQAEWAAGLAGYHDAEIARGVAACRTRVFAPTLGEFLRLCRPALDPERAWLEAQDGLQARDRGEAGNWTHPAVWRAAVAMSAEVRGGEFAKHRLRWTRVMEQQLAAGWRADVPAPPVRVEHQPALRGPTPDERAALEKIKTLPLVERKAFAEAAAPVRQRIAATRAAAEPGTLQPLVDAIADATACAGGDEARARIALERVLAPKAVATC